MGTRFKPAYIDTLLLLLMILFAVKLLWFIVEIVWLPAEGVDHNLAQRVKPLYYKIRLSSNKPAQPIRPQVVKKPVGNVKDIKLLAVYNASDETVVTVEYKRKPKVLGRGDSVNGFILEGAGQDFATFSKNGKTYRVDLIKSKLSGKGSIVSVTPEAPKDNGRDTEGEIIDAGDHKIVDRTLFDHYLKNIDEIYTNIGIQEIKQGNSIKGFQVTFVKRGSPFAKLGMRRGDILKSINGEKLTSYNAAFEAYRNMKDVENITLVIQRGNKTMELEYEIN